MRFDHYLSLDAVRRYRRQQALPAVATARTASLNKLSLGIEETLSNADKADARRDIARTALAPHLFAIDRGHYPGSLVDLVPEYSDDLPLEPFTGKPFQ